jgi:hypothetical protein
MKPLEDIYKGGFFKVRHKLSWRAPYVCQAIVEVLKPESVIDVGCGIGDYVDGFQKLGITSAGIEGSDNFKKFQVPGTLVFQNDLRRAIKVPNNMRFDLAMSFEVAEHIEPEYSDIYTLNLTELSDQVLITAAPPGQKGHYHVNCQPPEYWVEKFDRFDYEFGIEPVKKIREHWEPVKYKKEMGAYYRNLMYFCRRPK